MSDVIDTEVRDHFIASVRDSPFLSLRNRTVDIGERLRKTGHWKGRAFWKGGTMRRIYSPAAGIESTTSIDMDWLLEAVRHLTRTDCCPSCHQIRPHRGNDHAATALPDRAALSGGAPDGHGPRR